MLLPALTVTQQVWPLEASSGLPTKLTETRLIVRTSNSKLHVFLIKDDNMAVAD